MYCSMIKNFSETVSGAKSDWYTICTVLYTGSNQRRTPYNASLIIHALSVLAVIHKDLIKKKIHSLFAVSTYWFSTRVAADFDRVDRLYIRIVQLS